MATLRRNDRVRSEDSATAYVGAGHATTWPDLVAALNMDADYTGSIGSSASDCETSSAPSNGTAAAPTPATDATASEG